MYAILNWSKELGSMKCFSHGVLFTPQRPRVRVSTRKVAAPLRFSICDIFAICYLPVWRTGTGRSIFTLGRFLCTGEPSRSGNGTPFWWRRWPKCHMIFHAKSILEVIWGNEAFFLSAMLTYIIGPFNLSSYASSHIGLLARSSILLRQDLQSIALHKLA